MEAELQQHTKVTATAASLVLTPSVVSSNKRVTASGIVLVMRQATQSLNECYESKI
jgi:hypothetical protein